MFLEFYFPYFCLCFGKLTTALIENSLSTQGRRSRCFRLHIDDA